MILRLLKKLLTAESIGLILVLVALGTMIYGISYSLRDVDSGSLLRVCFVSAMISLGLAKIKTNGIFAAMIMITLGFIGAWILGAGLTYPLVDLFRALTAISSQIFPNVSYQFDGNALPLLPAWQTVLSASTALSTRLHTWYISLGTNHVISDPLIRNLIWVLVFWFLSAWMGWFTGKRSAVTALLPAILAMAEVTAYSKYRIDSLWLIVVVMLLLMGVWNYRNTTAKWEQQKVDYSDSIRFDTGQAVILFSVVIGLLAFITPSVSWRDVRDYFQRHPQNQQREAPAEILGIKQAPYKPKVISTATPSLPREHLLSGGFAQSESVVMTIRTGELAPVNFSEIPIVAPRYYWRSTIYDEYVGAGWVTSLSVPQNYKANTPLIPGVLNGYRPLHLDVRVQEPQGKLFWSGVLYSVDIPFRAEWRIRPGSDPFADQTALLQADLFSANTNVTSYTEQVYLPVVTIEDLRNAPSEYPDEIQKRYLQLPEKLPDRVHQLAVQITRGKTNPYEKTKAIEEYLRKNFPYDLNIPAPPKDKDVADYFLFDLKRGYCDYYATAMVALARSVGIPARFVSGYASGDYDQQSALYVVRELHAHSWPEVYFPQIGWVEFEPTASQPEIIRAEKNLNFTAPQKQQTNIAHLLFQLTHGTSSYWLSPIMLALILLFLYYSIIERNVFMLLAPSTAIEKLYRRYYRLGRRLAGPPTRAETAHEYTNKLTNKLEDIYLNSNNSFLTEIKTALAQFTHIYQSSLFSNHKMDKHDARMAYQLWRRLRHYLILSRLKYFFQITNDWIKKKVTTLSFKST